MIPILQLPSVTSTSKSHSVSRPILRAHVSRFSSSYFPTLHPVYHSLTPQGLRPSRRSQQYNVYFFRPIPLPFLPPPPLRCLKYSIIFTERELPSVLVTAETPELLQRRRSLVSAGRCLHRHRRRLHGSESGPGQAVVVHITRRPRSTDSYSRPVHRRRAARHLTLKS